ncbi:hypothetical protein HYV82_01550 [Candidatus Woesearchaeota archaeon]|nr:hypothetical protein [Candidatus Woesearchaeota archaeon]
MISDATCIIALSRIGRLYLLKELFKTVIIPEDVKKEVLVEGKEGFQEISKAIEDGWLKIAATKKRLELGLGDGETDALSLAKETNDALILDDTIAIRAANVLNIRTIRTAAVFVMAINKGIMNKDKAIELLNSLIEAGYYISTVHYSAILAKLKE